MYGFLFFSCCFYGNCLFPCKSVKVLTYDDQDDIIRLILHEFKIPHFHVSNVAYVGKTLLNNMPQLT